MSEPVRDGVLDESGAAPDAPGREDAAGAPGRRALGGGAQQVTAGEPEASAAVQASGLGAYDSGPGPGQAIGGAVGAAEGGLADSGEPAGPVAGEFARLGVGRVGPAAVPGAAEGQVGRRAAGESVGRAVGSAAVPDRAAGEPAGPVVDVSVGRAVGPAGSAAVQDGAEGGLPAAGEPVPLGVRVEATGYSEVDALLTRLEDADILPTEDHIEVYEDVHRGLRDALTALDNNRS